MLHNCLAAIASLFHDFCETNDENNDVIPVSLLIRILRIVFNIVRCLLHLHSYMIYPVLIFVRISTKFTRLFSPLIMKKSLSFRLRKSCFCVAVFLLLFFGQAEVETFLPRWNLLPFCFWGCLGIFRRDTFHPVQEGIQVRGWISISTFSSFMFSLAILYLKTR